MAHDYKRNNTTTLFAALEVATGKMIGSYVDKHRHEEFLKGLELHLILDNYATHEHAEVKTWLGKHPRLHMHCPPTSSPWLNLVERWFRDLTDRALRRGVFHSVPNLLGRLEEYVQVNNEHPKPLIWLAPAGFILEKKPVATLHFKPSNKTETCH